jgi:twinfilin-like protein
MSATSGIAVSPELASTFANAVSSKNVRFLKISIQNEALVTDTTVPPSSTLENDLNSLQSLLDDNVPAYVFVRLDDPPTAWLAIHYVPDTARVRDKVPPSDITSFALGPLRLARCFTPLRVMS